MKKLILFSGFLILGSAIGISGCTRSSNELVSDNESKQNIEETVKISEDYALHTAGEATNELQSEMKNPNRNKTGLKKKTDSKTDIKKDVITEKNVETEVVKRKPRAPRVADDSDMQRGSFDFREYKKRMGYDDRTQIENGI